MKAVVETQNCSAAASSPRSSSVVFLSTLLLLLVPPKIASKVKESSGLLFSVTNICSFILGEQLLLNIQQTIGNYGKASKYLLIRIRDE